MANTKPVDTDNSLWQGYNLQTSPATNLHPSPYDYPAGPPATSYHDRQQRGGYRSLDIPSMQTRPPPYDGNVGLTASPPNLSSHHSYPSMKRGFHSSDEPSYGEVVQDYREDISVGQKPSINQDHRLLSFSRLPDKQAIVDSHGRVHQIDLSAQIHGMFFLSELATSSGGGLVVQPELTCYRRNLFQISGTVTTPRGSLLVINDRGERVPIVSMEIVISSSESVDGNPVKLIVIPWKTPPPNSPEVGPGQEQEPAPIPLLSFEENSSDSSNDLAVFPIAYRRLQFRIATANNGRRRELQQHFTLHLNLIATLADGSKAKVCATSTAPIVVRGRSPRNFQARKEIPLVGSSSSRGGPPELYIATPIAPGTLSTSNSTAKGKNSRSQTLELPRSGFNFDASHLPPSPALMRTSTYPAYLPSHTSEQTTAPNTPSYQAPVALDSYLQANQPDQDPSPPNTASISRSQAPPPHYSYTSPPNHTQAAPQVRFIDSNPRPAKSPRHVAPPELPPANSFSDFGSRFPSPYGVPGNRNLPAQDPAYFPPPAPMTQSWSASSDATGVYGTSNTMPAPSQGQHYQFPNEGYVKGESDNQNQNYNWNTS